jgi:hypothetical protein
MAAGNEEPPAVAIDAIVSSKVWMVNEWGSRHDVGSVMSGCGVTGGRGGGGRD